MKSKAKRRKQKIQRAVPASPKQASKPVFVLERQSALLPKPPGALPRYVNSERNVFEAALDRIRWLFDEFDGNVAVWSSGGKDSIVVTELAAMVAKERGGAPLRVMWLDQECEYQATVDYQRYLMYERDDIDFRWYQIPFLLENSTNHSDPWLRVWDPERPEDWVRPKEPGSIHENVYGADKFHELLSMIAVRDLTEDWCQLDGMRVEESPARRLTMTSHPVYKWVTWSHRDSYVSSSILRQPGTSRMRFDPIYDWSFRDVWKAIHTQGWRYNTFYDAMFRYGHDVQTMRVSNYHHETSVVSLGWLQEVEPETWEAATRRLEGISTWGHLSDDQFPDQLPFMFSGWVEYTQYLIDNLVGSPEDRENFQRQWNLLTRSCPDLGEEKAARFMGKIVVGNDLYGTKVKNFLSKPGMARMRLRDTESDE